MTSDKKLFFSLEGVDIHDDTALDAFAHQVWERFTQAHPTPQAPEDPEPPGPPQAPEDPRSPGDPQSHPYRGDVRT
jgi:hypothetical protein